jgi:protein-disulfide isomerase
VISLYGPHRRATRTHSYQYDRTFLGLDRISPCAPLIDKLLKSGIDSGMGGTPPFFVNGVRYDELMGFKDIL